MNAAVDSISPLPNEHDVLPALIRSATGAQQAILLETVQRLWKGYGEILRYALVGADRTRLIVKRIRFHSQSNHGDFAHQRKVKSYQIEAEWYRYWSHRCDDKCRVPTFLASQALDDGCLILLEDLDHDFPLRHSMANADDWALGLRWLANFHATFLQVAPRGLWEVGTYWHLGTRQSEWRILKDMPLKKAAEAIDAKLRESPFQTVVHGDAKLENFCFSSDGKQIAAVDFQYVGGGCGMKDVAYFIDSCVDGIQAERLQESLLTLYFAELKQALQRKRHTLDFAALEQNWRELYPLAWTDFYRFLKGWSPGAGAFDSYSERLASAVIQKLKIH